ncbi:MAG: hypothetical protein IIW27_04370 [Clostridia bacterium]|jgi:hypothetical protein|nr:hypothetical protein [Clostridia bacterium]
MGYIKCPRCDLNYILEEEQYCNVCKADLKMGPKLLFANDDEDISEETELCPICKQNYIRNNENMCKACLQELASRRDDIDIDMDKDEEWRTFLDDDKDDDMDDIPEGFSAEIAEAFEEEEEDSYTGEKTPAFEEPDDFDIGPVDASDFEDREEEEDFEDDDEDDDL